VRRENAPLGDEGDGRLDVVAIVGEIDRVVREQRLDVAQAGGRADDAMAQAVGRQDRRRGVEHLRGDLLVGDRGG